MSQTQTSNDVVKFCHYVVTIIDVLGQCEKMSQMTSIPETPEQKAAFIGVLKQTFGTVNGLRSRFKNFFEKYRKPQYVPGSPTGDNVAAMMEGPMERTDLRLGTQFFADLFLFYAPVYEVEDHFSMEELYAMLIASAMLMQVSLAAQIALRGGIDIGIAAEMQPNEVYGNALCRAHYLESRVAQFPRIAVGREVLVLVGLEASRVGTGLSGMLNSIRAGLCAKLIQLDFDGILSVDFLGTAMREIAGQIDSGYRDMIQKGHNFVVSEHQRFMANASVSDSCRKLAMRYGLLRGYYESRIGLWT
jgi:hypothetical protein